MSRPISRRTIWQQARDAARQFTALSLSALLVVLVGCSTAGQPPSFNNGGGGGGGGNGPQNIVAISVNGGPFANTGNPSTNVALTTVTVCVPGSTTQCQTIDNILVDTGSFGLRIEQQALNLTLPQQTANGNPVVECAAFGSGFAWGPVQSADFTIAGESAKSLPLQVMGSPNFPDTDQGGAATCANGMAGSGSDLNTPASLGANGILGVGNFAHDCGIACTQSPNTPGFYYSCPTASTCIVTTEALASQVINPVAMFSTDNNGVVVELPALTNGLGTTVNGSLIFGIGTESNNGLGNATIYDVDPTFGNFTTVFNNITYTDEGFLDSGSNFLFFLDPAATGLPQCAVNTTLYCPVNNVNLTATNEGFSNGNSGMVNFTIADADNLLANDAQDNAFSMIGGEGIGQNGALVFDWGLPFFYGTNVFVAINGATTPAGPGPYVAY